MNKLTQALMEELTVEYVKVGSLQIPESVVISWVIMLLLVVGSILLTRNLKVDHISKRQAALEALYSLGKNFFEGLLGKEGSRYVPYLMTVALLQRDRCVRRKAPHKGSGCDRCAGADEHRAYRVCRRSRPGRRGLS